MKQEKFNLYERVNDFQTGLLTALELINEIQWAESVTKESVQYPFQQVFLIYSNGVYFAIQSGKCFKIDMKLEITES